MGSDQTSNEPPLYSSDPLNRSACNRVIFCSPLFADESARESACFFIKTWMMTDKFDRDSEPTSNKVMTDQKWGHRETTTGID